jgi:hypothetical protein
MRALLLAVTLVAVSACHPPSLRVRAAKTGSQFVHLGGKIVAVVRPAAPVIQAQLQATATDQARARAQAVAAEPQTLSFHSSHTVRHVDGGDGGDGGNARTSGTAMPEPTITRTTVAPVGVGLHARTQAGKNTCQVYKAIDECNASCTSMLRMGMMRAPGPDDITSCSCTEGVGC